MDKIILRLQKALDFLHPHIELANSHMVNFFTGNLWSVHVPLSLQEEFLNNSLQAGEIVDFFTQSYNSGCNDLGKFLQECSNVCPTIDEDILVDFESLPENMKNLMGTNGQFLLTKNTFMSEKKEHEVALMSVVVQMLTSFTNSSHIVDLGDGKGYLSSRLAMQKGLKVLGVDCCETKTSSASKRTTKMKKHLIPPEENAHNKYDEVSPKSVDSACLKEETYSIPYKQITAFVSPDTNLREFLFKSFPNDSHYDFGIVGLHTCGNLSPVSFKLFVQNGRYSRFLVNVGCCYHLLDEGSSEDSPSFPVSKFLQNKNFKLGRNARMLSLQAPDRIYSSRKVPDALMFRAVLEAFLVEKIVDLDKHEREVGRIGSKCKNFEEYCRRALTKLGIEANVLDNEMEELYNNYKSQLPMLEYFFMLRVSIAPVIEHIILLDRLLYLHENGMPNSFILKVFDPTTSPRCYAIVSVNNA